MTTIDERDLHRYPQAVLDEVLQGLMATPTLLARAGRLAFPPDIEHRFNRDLRTFRIRELRFTIALGIALDTLTNVTDFVFVPDIMSFTWAIRLAALIPFIVLAFLLERVSDFTRETLVMLSSLVVVTSCVLIAALSGAPDASYGYATASLALLFAVFVFPLRFADAVLVNTIQFVFLVLVLLSGRTPQPLASMLALQGFVASLFSLVGNFKIERMARINYILSCKNDLQKADLSADRDRLRILSRTDGLTGLSNRSHLESHIATLETGHPRQICAMLIDVDHFKRYNDNHGHAEGDRCLQMVSAVIRSGLQSPADLAVRYGGEEFLLLLQGIAADEASAVAERIRAAVAAIPRMRQPVTVSIGLAQGVTGAGGDVSLAIERADAALYRSKHRGRNRVTATA